MKTEGGVPAGVFNASWSTRTASVISLLKLSTSPGTPTAADSANLMSSQRTPGTVKSPAIAWTVW